MGFVIDKQGDYLPVFGEAEGGGTSDHSQLINLDYANSGHTGFMKDDASNLTATGKKVFDGQWICPNDAIVLESSTAAVTNGKNYDLSKLLPEDNYIYEIMLRGWANTSATTGATHNLSIKTDILKNQAYLCGSKAYTNTAGTDVGTITIPIGTARTLTLQPYPANTGTYGLAIIAYRRIGTNS